MLRPYWIHISSSASSYLLFILPWGVWKYDPNAGIPFSGLKPLVNALSSLSIDTHQIEDAIDGLKLEGHYYFPGEMFLSDEQVRRLTILKTA